MKRLPWHFTEHICHDNEINIMINVDVVRIKFLCDEDIKIEFTIPSSIEHITFYLLSSFYDTLISLDLNTKNLSKFSYSMSVCILHYFDAHKPRKFLYLKFNLMFTPTAILTFLMLSPFFRLQK